MRAHKLSSRRVQPGCGQTGVTAGQGAVGVTVVHSGPELVEEIPLPGPIPVRIVHRQMGFSTAFPELSTGYHSLFSSLTFEVGG